LAISVILLEDLINALFAAVEDAIGNETNLAVAFSGGLDSSLLAKICKDIGADVTLLTVGFSGSIDIPFSKGIANKMNLPHRVLELDTESFKENADQIYNKIKCKVISHIENCIGFFFIGRFARANGFRTILSGNGCDELFCGYDRFRSVYDLGEKELMMLTDKKLENEFELMQEIDGILKELGVNLIQPFLTSEFISFAKSIPIDQKIIGPRDMIRKHILRQVAVSINVPIQAAMQRKKALQYSSLIHRNFCKLRIE
jgi:asparagine synthase (glutamine-hydrolysing)